MFRYLDHSLHCEQAPLADIAAGAGTPATSIRPTRSVENYRAYDEALGDVAAHGLLRGQGQFHASRFLRCWRAPAPDSISFRAASCTACSQAGGDPARVVFSGVGKTADEVDYALAQRHSQLQLRVRSRSWR